MPSNSAKSVVFINDIFEHNYNASTFTNNTVAQMEYSKRNKQRTNNCEPTLRRNAQASKLKAKVRKRERARLEKLVAEHEAGKVKK